MLIEEQNGKISFTFDPSRDIASFYQYLFKLIPVKPNIILHSGRGCTKSTFFGMWNITRLMYYKNADGLVLSYEKSSIGKKVFGNYKEAARYLHLTEGVDIVFHNGGINSDYYILVRNVVDGTWNKIFFETGKGGAEMLKGTLPTDGHRWLFVSFYELTNFINLNDTELSSIYATILRTTYSKILWEEVYKFCKENNFEFKHDEDWLFEQSWLFSNYNKFYTKEFCFEYEFNTPAPGPSQWVMDWSDNFRKRDDVWYQFNTYEDMTDREKMKFLKPDTLNEIERLKVNNPIAYNHEWKGKEAYDGNISFPGLSVKEHFGHHPNFHPDVIVIGVDVGLDDPTVCVANGYEYRGKDLRVEIGMHCYYYGKRKQWYYKDDEQQPFPSPEKQWKLGDYAKMIRDFCDMVHYKYPYAEMHIQFDRHGAGQLFYNETFKTTGLKYLRRRLDWEGTTLFDRYTFIDDLIHTPGVLKIPTKLVFDSYRNQINDKKKELETGQVKRLDNQKIQRLTLDIQDAAEYGILKPYFKDFRARMKIENGKWTKELQEKANEKNFMRWF